MRRKICAIALAVLTLSLPVHSFASGGVAEKAASAELAAFEEEAEEVVWEEDDARESESVADSPWESAAETLPAADESTALMDDTPDATPTPSPSPTAAPAVTPGVTYSVTVTGGSGSGRYHPGEIITVAMDPAPDGMRLKSVNHTKDVPFTRVTGADRVTYTFVMPAFDVSVRAVYEENVYTVTVTGGSGSGQYHPGDTVTVSAYPATTGKRLWGWQHTSGFQISFGEDAGSLTGSFEMPSKAVWLAVVYTDATGGRQWMRLDGNKVTISAKDADQRNLQGTLRGSVRVLLRSSRHNRTPPHEQRYRYSAHLRFRRHHVMADDCPLEYRTGKRSSGNDFPAEEEREG